VCGLLEHLLNLVFRCREVGKRRGVPAQEFSVRSDMACGSTIGPILASSLGCRTVDVGAPQLSMHSIREMCGVDDVGHSYRHFLAFFQVRSFSETLKSGWHKSVRVLFEHFFKSGGGDRDT
jgi:hypothetical protein